MRLSPLRLWLQSASLLAVLAGYSLLLLVNQRIAASDRVAAPPAKPQLDYPAHSAIVALGP